MPNLHEPLRTYSGRRCVLVVDDELVNREILRNYLCNDYEVLCAADGTEALRLMRERKDALSLVLLDLLMPVMSGYEVLKSAKADEELKHIPVIVTTSEQAAELESLQLGAIDFVPKRSLTRRSTLSSPVFCGLSNSRKTGTLSSPPSGMRSPAFSTRNSSIATPSSLISAIRT